MFSTVHPISLPLSLPLSLSPPSPSHRPLSPPISLSVSLTPSLSPSLPLFLCYPPSSAFSLDIPPLYRPPFPRPHSPSLWPSISQEGLSPVSPSLSSLVIHTHLSLSLSLSHPPAMQRPLSHIPALSHILLLSHHPYLISRSPSHFITLPPPLSSSFLSRQPYSISHPHPPLPTSLPLPLLSSLSIVFSPIYLISLTLLFPSFPPYHSSSFLSLLLSHSP